MQVYNDWRGVLRTRADGSPIPARHEIPPGTLLYKDADNVWVIVCRGCGEIRRLYCADLCQTCYRQYLKRMAG